MASDGVRAVTFHPQRRSRPPSRNKKSQCGPHRWASKNVKYHLKSVQSDIGHALWGPQSGFPMTITGPRCDFSSATAAATAVADRKSQRGPHRRASENVHYTVKSVQTDIIPASWGPQSGFPMAITGPRRCGNVIADETLQRGPVIVTGKPLWGPRRACTM